MDTSNVDLGDCQHLIDALTRNVHEVWAELRMKDGWAYGRERDDTRRLHPCLVPFEELPESDRAFDHAMTKEFLSAAVLLGFHK